MLGTPMMSEQAAHHHLSTLSAELNSSIHKFGDLITWAASSARGTRVHSTRTGCLHTTPSIPCSATAPYARPGGKSNGTARNLPQADQTRSQIEGHMVQPRAAQRSAQRPRPVRVSAIGTWRSLSRTGVAARAASPPPPCQLDGLPLSMEMGRGTWTRRSSSRRRPRQRPTTCPPQRHARSSRARGAVGSPLVPGAAGRCHSSSLRARRSDGPTMAGRCDQRQSVTISDTQ